MKRARLALLVASALLSTSIQPFDWTNSSAVIEPKPIEITALPAVSAPPATELGIASARSGQADPTPSADEEQRLGGEILRRLSIRHTGLTRHERVELAAWLSQNSSQNAIPVRDPRVGMHILDPTGIAF